MNNAPRNLLDETPCWKSCTHVSNSQLGTAIKVQEVDWIPSNIRSAIMEMYWSTITHYEIGDFPPFVIILDSRICSMKCKNLRAEFKSIIDIWFSAAEVGSVIGIGVQNPMTLSTNYPLIAELFSMLKMDANHVISHVQTVTISTDPRDLDKFVLKWCNINFEPHYLTYLAIISALEDNPRALCRILQYRIIPYSDHGKMEDLLKAHPDIAHAWPLARRDRDRLTVAIQTSMSKQCQLHHEDQPVNEAEISQLHQAHVQYALAFPSKGNYINVAEYIPNSTRWNVIAHIVVGPDVKVPCVVKGQYIVISRWKDIHNKFKCALKLLNNRNCDTAALGRLDGHRFIKKSYLCNIQEFARDGYFIIQKIRETLDSNLQTFSRRKLDEHVANTENSSVLRQNIWTSPHNWIQKYIAVVSLPTYLSMVCHCVIKNVFVHELHLLVFLCVGFCADMEEAAGS